MPMMQVPDETEAERLAYQRAIDHAAEMLRLTQACPDELVVASWEFVRIM